MERRNLQLSTRSRSCLFPRAVAATVPPELWTKMFDSLDKAFFPDGRPEIHMEGRCKCGKLQFRVDGRVSACFMCHCALCRSYLARSSPSHSLWVEPPEALSITAGKDHLKQWTVERISRKVRSSATVDFCGSCGTNINAHFADPGAKFTLTWPSNFEREEWDDTPRTLRAAPATGRGYSELLQPRFHAHYENRAVDVEDSLPKLADICLEDAPLMSNSGEVVGKVAFPMPQAYRHEQRAKL